MRSVIKGRQTSVVFGNVSLLGTRRRSDPQAASRWGYSVPLLDQLFCLGRGGVDKAAPDPVSPFWTGGNGENPRSDGRGRGGDGAGCDGYLPSLILPVLLAPRSIVVGRYLSSVSQKPLRWWQKLMGSFQVQGLLFFCRYHPERVRLRGPKLMCHTARERN